MSHPGLELRQAASRRAHPRARRPDGQAPALERRHDRRAARPRWNGTLMAGRPTKDTPSRIDPRTGRPLPEGIPWRTDRQRYQVRVVGPSVDGGAAERSRMFLTLAEAKRELAKMVAGRNPNGSMTLEQWHEKYWPAIESSVRPATARGYGVAWRLRVKPSLGRQRLEDITSPMIESAMVAWSAGASAKNDALAVLSRLLDGARRSRFIDYNPAREVKRPSMRESVSPISRALTLEQVRTLLELVPEGAYRNYVAALVYTGMRAGGRSDGAARRRRRLRTRHHPGQSVAEPGAARRTDRAVAEEPQVARGSADRRAAPVRRAGRARQAAERSALFWARRRTPHEPQRSPRGRLGGAAKGDRPARLARPRPQTHVRDDPVRCRRQRSRRAGDARPLEPAGHRAVLTRSRRRCAPGRCRSRSDARRGGHGEGRRRVGAEELEAQDRRNGPPGDPCRP
ncbi:hypothetical protein GE115_09640 [Agromyces sp. CFH 90414]|uniref:Integrase SAM-like N-terminal domain-containing protein n=1 Tax=Agromyces agglutinans TaxID=2662258 RepID=A0A6I2F741_9MICO|nr:hypothetical protein [Agromyces agglutinans]